MSNSESTSNRKFHMNIKLSPEYATWRSANHMALRDANEAHRLRIEGKKNIDLWTDGSLYPKDPSTGRSPPFYSVHDLIRFVGDGMNGLLGYCTNLNQSSNDQLQIIMNLNTALISSKTLISGLEKRVKSLEETNVYLTTKLQNLKETPKGLRERVRQMKHIKALSDFSGARKKRMRLAREFISQVSGLDMNVCEDRVQLFNETMNKSDIIKVLLLKENTLLRKNVLKELLKEMHSVVDATQMVETCDTVGVSRRGYRALSGVWFKNLKQHRVRAFGLPRANKVAQARTLQNLDIPKYFGDYFHIEDSMPYEKNKRKSTFHYTIYNNIWMDLRKIQIAMVKMYGITVDECNGHLKFVLKLDEAQIQKSQKMERISISLMNRAIEYSLGSTEEPNYKVQSEMELWWLGCAHVPIENHETLKWLFSHTEIPSIIESQNAGECLTIEDVGSFTIEWHMSADLKALKSMFGISGGPKTKYPCLYCMNSMGTPDWTDPHSIGEPPSRSSIDLRKFKSTETIWDPILSISLKNVHICTLHAEIRILDKLLRLHLDYAYSIKPSTLSNECIDKCEILL